MFLHWRAYLKPLKLNKMILELSTKEKIKLITAIASFIEALNNTNENDALIKKEVLSSAIWIGHSVIEKFRNPL